LISFGISLTITVVNIILKIVIYRLTSFERDYSLTAHQASLAIKSILAQMINNIIIPVVLAY